MDKNLEKAILFFKKTIPQLDYMDVKDRDSILLEDLINYLKKNPRQTWTATRIASQITNNCDGYKKRIGELARDHCEFGILTFDRSRMLKVEAGGLSLYCWNPGYVTKLENRERKRQNFDKHAEVFMENEQETVCALVKMLPIHRRDTTRAQMVYDYMSVYIESNCVAPHVTNLKDYKQNKLPK